MTYDFTTQPKRTGHHSVKWKEVEQNSDFLPLWVADMDFVAWDEMQTALSNYVTAGDYGYTYIDDEFYKTITDWEEKQHGYKFDKSAIVLLDGVVPGISLAIQALTAENEAVLINNPVYPPFARTVKLNNRKLIENKLLEENGEFVFDYEQLEKDIVENAVKLYVLCNPNNPGGRVWRIDELEKIGQICQKYNVILVSDEIHQDLALFGHKHHSINTISDDFRDFTVVLTSATKTFNIAGTKCAYAVIENEKLRAKYLEKRLGNNQHEVSTLGIIATEIAYKHGEKWLSELKTTLEKNIDFVVEQLNENTKIKVMKPQGTYLIWLDFSAYDIKNLDEFLREKAKLILNIGSTFGQGGENHARLNAASPFDVIQEATKRLIEACQNL